MFSVSTIKLNPIQSLCLFVVAMLPVVMMCVSSLSTSTTGAVLSRLVSRAQLEQEWLAYCNAVQREHDDEKAINLVNPKKWTNLTMKDALSRAMYNRNRVVAEAILKKAP